MMRGTTRRRQGILPITFCLPGQSSLTLEFVVDSGFTEFLTLPVAAVSAMRLPFLHNRSAYLAGGSTTHLRRHDFVERRCLTIKNCESGSGKMIW